MRNVVRLASLLAAATLFTSTPTASAASVLVMGGTFTPAPAADEVARNIADFINPTLGLALTPADATVVPYPASGGIVSGPGAPTINQSVAIGVENLEAALAQTPGRVIVFGFSQSTVVSMIEKERLEERRAAGLPAPDVTFVGIGVGNRPNGGIASRLEGLTIPIFDFTFNGPAPTDPEFGFTTFDIVREYDGLADFPLYPVNLLADVNALLGIVFVHARYDEVSVDPMSPKYLPGTVVQQYGDTTYYQIPTADLPLFDLARIFGVPESLIDIVEPTVKVIVDAGYDRTIPFGQPTGLRLAPALDPAKFATDLLASVGQGVANAVEAIAPPVPAAEGYPGSDDEAAGPRARATRAVSTVGGTTVSATSIGDQQSRTATATRSASTGHDEAGDHAGSVDHNGPTTTTTPTPESAEPTTPAQSDVSSTESEAGATEDAETSADTEGAADD